MNKVIFTLLLIVLAQIVFAKTDGYVVSRISGDFARASVNDTLLDTIYDHETMLPNGTQSPDGASYKFARNEITLTLCVNPNNANPPANSFTSSVEFVVAYKTTPAAAVAYKTGRLLINYNPNAGSVYKAKDMYVLKGVVWAVIKTVNKSVLSIPADDNSLQLHFQYSADKFFPPNVSQSPVVNSFLPSSNNGYLKLQWKELPWAERYDVEWLFVDNYDGTPTGEKSASQIAYDFRHNNTRVTTQNTELEIPMVFEKGYVLARVRAVGLSGTTFEELQYGRWSAFNTNSGNSIPTDAGSVFKVTASQVHEADKMNWSFTGAFGGDDLHKENVIYRDGTLRQRQTVSNAQTDLNLLVTETIYDHQGRAALQTLPAAIKSVTSTTGASTTVTIGGGGTNPFSENFGLYSLPFGATFDVSYLIDLFRYSTTHPKIGYQKNFNRNTDEQPYNKADFDLDRDGCSTSAEPFSANSGAGKYYSPNNADKTGFNQFIPDGQGYPFTQISYTPDKTGRLASISKAGAELKKGSGHETKIYYGTPSQDELDRMFGNDAGIASRYKKEMMIDENGQAHVTYKDMRGNMVASALTGLSPEVYTPLPQGGDVNINLHLVEEDNRVETSTNSLVSQKSLLLGKRSNVAFSYSLTPPSYHDRYCNNTSLCYDCVYDLTIDVRNDCGEIFWHEKQRIGNLNDLNTCSATPVSFPRTVELDPGNYFISKRLTVNDSSVNVYVNDYKAHLCVQPTSHFQSPVGEPCQATCNTCPQTAAERTFNQRDATGSHTVTFPVQMRGTNDGNCMRYCNTGLASVCASALEMLLADVSPGGQYGEYLDTTNIDFPLGIVNPPAFPLSVFNTANQLPLMGATWQIPAFDYQNRNGSVSYIEIGADNLPSHREVDVIVIDGKRYVKPAYLNDVRDFIRYWQPQWAEALVVYHPEYPYYIWCVNKKQSSSYDSLMRNTATHAEAAARSLINHRTLACVNDPFFRDGLPADAATMNTNLIRHTPLTGFDDLNVEEATYLAVNYNNVNASAANVNANVRGKTLYTFSTNINDKQWKFYREFYLLKKGRVYDTARRRWILSANYFDNSQIGTNSFGTVPNPLYADRTKRFVESQDAITFLPVDADSITESTLYALRDIAADRMKQSCGGCGISYELLSFFNALAIEKKIKQSNITLPDITPVVLSRGIVQTFSNRTALQYRWEATVNASSIRYKIFAGNDEQCTINLNSSTTAIDWDSIVRFDCFIATSSNEFTLRGLTGKDSAIQITGNSTCMNFRDCPSPRTCSKEPAADDMAVLMQYLFQRNRYRSAYIMLRDRTGYTPYFGEALSAFAPSDTRFVWRMKSITALEDSLSAGIRLYHSSLPESAECPVTLKVITPGFRLSQVSSIIDIRQPATTTCNVNEFILTALTSTGVRFEIRGQAFCYVFFKCCRTANPPASGGICCITPTPKIDYVPVCNTQADAIEANNRARAQEVAIQAAADSLRAKLVQHCLSAVEIFNATYSDAIYQITLMYYDRSNQLIKTVPPKDVVLASATQLADTRNYRRTGTGTAYYPVHAMATTYRYNSFNQLIQKSLPDEGTTRLCYDQNGRAIMSQDATQLAANACSYTLYDNNGRAIEGGRRNYSGAIPSYMNYGVYIDEIRTAIKSEITKTVFDQMPSSGTPHFAAGRKNLRNRVAAIMREENSGTTDHAAYFDYDVLGNTRNMVQQFNKIKSLASGAFTATGSEVKKINYQYNSLTGKVKRVWYQPGKADQFIHWYQYDEDGRTTKIQTGTNPNEMEMLRETDAQYYYYPHGPLARVELGSEKVQGIDYAYTISGLLKSINSGSATKQNDMGSDGGSGEIHGHFIPDVFGEELNYFRNDYLPISDAVDFPVQTSGALIEGFSKPLYNGFIRNTISTLNVDFPGATPSERMAARAYKYDQAMRLTDMQMIFANSEAKSIASAFTGDYKMHLHYDANGNIDTLQRRKRGADMDDLTYIYAAGNNRLQNIHDHVGSSFSDNDLGSKTYSYDVCGRMINDGNSNIAWNNSGLLKQYGTNNYGYSAMGKRTWKQTSAGIEFYVNDASGNSLASYQISGSEIRLEDLNVYGATRIGTYHLNKVINDLSTDVTRDSFSRGLKRYEITNHIGDVQVVLSDKRVRTSLGNSADVISATDYYPFGMAMPGRSFGARDYRYGYQGMECDDEAVANGDNEYTTEFRQYDPRVGRWLSVEPLARNYPGISVYASNFNSPTNFVDKDGECPIIWGAIIGGGVGIGMELYSAYTDPTYEFGWDAMARVGISTGAGALTGGLSVLAPEVGLGVVVLGSMAIEGSANALSQSATIAAGHADEFHGEQVLLAMGGGALGAVGGAAISSGVNRVVTSSAVSALTPETRIFAGIVAQNALDNSAVEREAAEALLGGALNVGTNLLQQAVAPSLDEALTSALGPATEDPGAVLLEELEAEDAARERAERRARRERAERRAEPEPTGRARVLEPEGDIGFDIFGGGGEERPAITYEDRGGGVVTEHFRMGLGPRRR